MVNSSLPAGDVAEEKIGLAALVAAAKRHVLLFFDYFAQYAKVRVSYRGDFFISLGTSFAATIFGLGFVVILFQKATQLAGWQFEEVLFLYGFSLIPYGIFNIVSMNLYDFGNNFIIEGKFDRVLLRPISSLFQVLFETFRIESLQEVATGIFCLWWASRRLGLAWTPAKFAMLFFFGVCAAVIYVSIFLLLSTVSFWFEDRIGVHPPVWNVIAFGRYPLSIYSGAVQFPVLDRSLRPRILLPQRAHARPNRAPRIRPTRSGSCARISHTRNLRVEHRHPSLLLHRVLSFFIGENLLAG